MSSEVVLDSAVVHSKLAKITATWTKVSEYSIKQLATAVVRDSYKSSSSFADWLFWTDLPRKRKCAGISARWPHRCDGQSAR